MNKYNNSKIYAIRSSQTQLIYIGSTYNTLIKRFIGHKSDHKTREGFCTSTELLKYDDAYIELIENFPCNSKKELKRREGQLQIENKDICVNKLIAGRTRKETSKLWRETHKEHLAKRMREYRAQNPEHFKEYNKQYSIKHKEYLNDVAQK